MTDAYARISYGSAAQLGAEWQDDVRRALARLGWTAEFREPNYASGDDVLELTSATEAFEPHALALALADVAIPFADYATRASTLTPLPVVVDATWWDQCTDPRALVAPLVCDPSPTFPRGLPRASFLQLACAARRRAPSLWGGPADAVFAAVEQYAGGHLSEDELMAVREAALQGRSPRPFDGPLSAPRRFWRAPDVFARQVCNEVLLALRGGPGDGTTFEAAKAALVGDVRAMFGNPFRAR